MELEMTTGPEHISTSSVNGAAALGNGRPSTAQELAPPAPPPVYGPEPPPSMAQSRAGGSAAAGLLSGVALPLGGDSNGQRPKDKEMAAITAKLHETFQSQLLTIMAEHGYDSMNCSMQDIADVLFSLGLLSSPTDDVADALRRHLQADLCRFMYSRLQEVTHGTVQGRMAQILTDPEAYARQCGADQHGETLEYDPDDPGELADGSGPQRHSFIRLFRGEMDAQFEAGCDEDGPPSLPPTEPEWAIALARRLLPAHVQTVDSLLAGGAEGSEGTDKQQKTKKKRRRPKKKGKAKADDCDEDEWSLSPTRTEQPQLPLPPPPPVQPPPQQQPQPQQTHQTPVRPSAAAGATRSLSNHSGAETAHRRGAFPKLLPDGGSDMGLDASSDNITEPGLVREFWLSLSETERQALVVVEKEVVLARVRDQQNFSCGCHVCTRKREAIERELDSLYDNYYDVLKRNARKANLRLWVASARKHAQSMILRLVEALTDMVVDKLDTQPEAATRKRVQQVVIRCLEQSPDAKVLFGPELHKLTGPESALRPSSLADDDDADPLYLDEDQSPASLDVSMRLQESLTQTLHQSLKASLYGSADAADDGDIGLGDGFAGGGRDLIRLLQENDDYPSEPATNSDLFYTEDMLDTIDTFPADSKKFFDMMERLAEYRLQREDALLDARDDEVDEYVLHDQDIADVHHAQRQPSPPPLPLPQRRCPDCHGEISDTDDPQAYPGPADRPADQYRSHKRPREEPRPESPDDGSGSDQYGPRDGYDVDNDYEEDEEDILDHGDDELGETDDDYDELDPESAEREIESGRKVFQLFAARLFEQRVINAYREKAARDMQRDLILELEAEEKRSQAKDKRKQKRKEREKEKKRHIQQQKEADRLSKEAQARAEEERRRQEVEQRVRDLEKRRRDESAKARKAQEERNRRILEQADRRLEKERQEKLRIEQEQAAKLRAEREARERESREREAKEQARRDQEARKPAKQAPRQRTPRAKQAAPSEPPVAPPPVAPPQKPAGAPSPAAERPAVAMSPLPPAPPPSLPPPLQMPAPPPFPVTAPMANGLVSGSGMPLLDSLQRTPRLESTSPFQAPRSSVPAIHMGEAPPAATTTPAFAQMRARANSGPNLQHPAMLSAPIPAMPPPPPAPVVVDVPPEIDAEIASIVGRVMGSFTLEGDLVGGAEWRASPTAVAADRPLPPALDSNLRRNSMPMNRLAPPEDTAAEIYAAYCALDTFHCDAGTVLPAGRGHGGRHRAADIAQFHGRLTETDVWHTCVGLASANAAHCAVDHAARAVSFARDNARATPPSQLAAVSECAFGAFGLHPPQTGSPLLPGAPVPWAGLAVQPQPASAPSQGTPLPSPFEQQRLGLGFAPPSSLFLGGPGVHGPNAQFAVPLFQPPALRATVQPLSLPVDPQPAFSLSYTSPFLTPDPWSPPKQPNGPAVQLHPLRTHAQPAPASQLRQQPL